MAWLQSAPLWLIGLAMLAVLVAAHELGIIVGRRWPAATADSRDSYLVPAGLALMGLLMAFTFGAAQDRFNLRQRMVTEEANAIGTAYLRTQLMDAPYRDELGREMLSYANVRAAFGATAGAEPIAALSGRTSAEQGRLWATATGAVQHNPAATLNGPLVQALNEMFDIAETRRAAGDWKIPISILRMLAIYSVAVAAIVGFAGQPIQRLKPVPVAVLALVTVSFCLILDLDRPASGSVTVSQAAMERAVASVRQSEARKALAAPPGGR